MNYVHGSQTQATQSKLKFAKKANPKNNPKNKKQAKVKYSQIRYSRVTKCILCGQSVESGKMLAHKHDVHGEKIYSCSTVGRSPKSQWVRIFQGGLPGLGKRKR
jgi:hypothetical protein